MKDKGIKGNSILGGTLSLTISTLIVKVLGLVYKIPLASILGDEGMGYFNSAYTVYTFFYLLCTAGVPKAVMILVSEARAKGREADENKIISTAARMFLLLGVVICLGFMIFSKPLARLIGNSPAWATMLAIAPSIIFISLAGVVRGYLNANMRLIEIAVSQIIEGVGKLVVGLVAGLLAFRAGMPLEMVSAMTILGVSFGAFVGLVYLMIISKVKITKEKSGQNNLVKRILSISLPITVSAAVMSLTNIIDLGLIMRSLRVIGYTEAEAGALYGNYTTLAVPMFNLALAIITPISVAHLPIFTKAIVSADTSLLTETETSALRFSAFVSAPMVLGLSVYSREILTLLFPSSEIEVGSMLLCLLVPAIVFSSMLLITNTALEAGGKVNAPLVSMLLGSLTKIIISYILIRNPSFGISGAPIGTVCSYATALVVSALIYRVKYRSNLPLFASYLPAYIFAGAAVLLSRPIYLSLTTKCGEILALAIAISFCAVLYFGVSLLFEFIKSGGKLRVAKYTKLTR